MPCAPDPLRVRLESVAPEVPRRPILPIVFSFPVMLGSLLIVLMVLTVRDRFNDPDMWWHLKTGELIWNTHSIPRYDPFSFTAFGKPWIAQEWLSELTIYFAYHFGGYTGLMLWLCTFSGLFAVAAYVLCCLYSGNSKLAMLGGMVAWFFSTIGLAIRPHLLGYTLLVCELILLHLGRTRNFRWLWGLPPLFALWINLHSSFFLGLVVLGIALPCSFLNFDLGLLFAERWNRTERRALLFASIASALSLLINPIGLKLIWYPIDVMLNQPLNLENVIEWQQPSFGEARGLGLLLVAGLILLIPMIRGKRLALQELLLVGVGFHFAVRHERMLFVFGIFAAPVLCRLLADAWDQYEPERDRPWPNALMMGIGFAVIIFAFPNTRKLEKQIRLGSPADALRFIQKSRLSGPMLNEYIYGGYVIWMAPEHKVFIDGRADVYEPAGVLAEYGKWNTLQSDPRDLLAKYKIRFCLLSKANGMSRVLALLPGWTRVYSDDVAEVFANRRT